MNIGEITLLISLCFLSLPILLVYMIEEIHEDIIDSYPLWQQQIHGTHFVAYDDGSFSQRFSRRVARDYAEIFGGTVIKNEDYKEVSGQRKMAKDSLGEFVKCCKCNEPMTVSEHFYYEVHCENCELKISEIFRKERSDYLQKITGLDDE